MVWARAAFAASARLGGSPALLPEPAWP